MRQKVVVVLGPTASGKSALAIKLARKFRGEIISADSRQVYKGMDIGTGKVSKAEQKLVPHHLLDIASPKKQFSVTEFKGQAQKKIADILSRGHLPSIAGGSAFYIYSVIDDLEFPDVKPNPKLRKHLEKKSTAQLFTMLKKLDPIRAKSIDKSNPRRLIRAIEIVKATGKPVPAIKQKNNYDALLLGIKTEQPKLYKSIDRRLDDRLKAGMLKEVKKLLKQGVTHKRLQEMGLEYKYLSLHLQKKLDYAQMVSELKNAIHHFSKRQMTWFKRDPRIRWVNGYSDSEKLMRRFLK